MTTKTKKRPSARRRTAAESEALAAREVLDALDTKLGEQLESLRRDLALAERTVEVQGRALQAVAEERDAARADAAVARDQGEYTPKARYVGPFDPPLAGIPPARAYAAPPEAFAAPEAPPEPPAVAIPTPSEGLRDALRLQMLDLTSRPPTPASLRAIEHAASAARDLLVAVESPEALLNYLPGKGDGDGPAEAPVSETFGVNFVRQILPMLREMSNPKREDTVHDLLSQLHSARVAGAPEAVLATIQRKIEAVTGATGAWTKPAEMFARIGVGGESPP